MRVKPIARAAVQLAAGADRGSLRSRERRLRRPIRWADKRRLVASICMTVLALGAGCSSGRDRALPSSTTEPAPTESDASTELSQRASAEGRIPVYIKDVDVEHRVLTVDSIELYLAEAAEQAHSEDLTGPPQEYDLYVKNDIYIKNGMTKLRKLRVAEGVSIAVLGPERADPRPTVRIGLDELKQYVAERPQVSPFWVEAISGRVQRIVEQYVP